MKGLNFFFKAVLYVIENFIVLLNAELQAQLLHH